MQRFPRFVPGLAVLAILAAFAVPACSDQGEGERCSLDSGDSDCGSGLLCTKVVSSEDVVDTLCCPPSDQPNRVAACVVGATVSANGGAAGTSDVGGAAGTSDVGGAAGTSDIGGAAGTSDVGGAAGSSDVGGAGGTSAGAGGSSGASGSAGSGGS